MGIWRSASGCSENTVQTSLNRASAGLPQSTSAGSQHSKLAQVQHRDHASPIT
jgi:hypothetical protein